MIRLPYQPCAVLAALLSAACGSTSSGSIAADDAGGNPSPGSQPPIEGGSPGSSDLQGDAASSTRDASSDAGVVARDAGSATDGGAGAASPRPSPGCTSQGAATASATVNLTYGSMMRTYILHVPAGAPSGPRPLVLNMHGYTGSASQQEGLTAMDAVSDQAGFFVAYPNGEGSPSDWNAGACCSAASEGDRDDEGFLGAVIDDIAARSCVDLARVYASGFSNGGMMTYRLGCEVSARFAAIASVSGSAVIPLDTCTPTHPMPLMHIHGNADPLVPYDGGAGGLPLSGRPTPIFPAAADEVAAFRTKDGCPSTSDVYFDSGNAHCDHWGPCQGGSDVVFCTISQGGHAWPGGTGASSESSPLDATNEIWTFFQKHALP
jgi:polyhydroxybutyrate depolymerase